MDAKQAALLEESFWTARRVARRKLSGELKRLFEPEDVAGEVILRIIPKADRLGDQMPAIAARSAEQWLIDAHRRTRTLKRDAKREVSRPLYDMGIGPNALADLIAEETFRRILGLTEGDEREIVDLKEGGHTTHDAAQAVGWNLRRVQRFLEALYKRII